ncbi:hypothetical protein BMW23_0092 [Bodo saltans virus]|uniref:Uncharacterized protein n=1 Tax=Bodo saltans virus TaxID=2024608 RepID=A0A2H4UT88_9VIRU|nr:hypothetical protein QJ851_gp0089 [Bodo saltans virus]ATZ80152.1 hypothetical protein BMW23_0092 [Bodo saltans virus]
MYINNGSYNKKIFQFFCIKLCDLFYFMNCCKILQKTFILRFLL